MRYLKSFFTSKKGLMVKPARPPKAEDVKFDVNEVLNAINECLAYLKDDYVIDIKNLYVNKFEVIIKGNNHENLHIRDVKESVMFMLEMINSNYILQEAIIYYKTAFNSDTLLNGNYEDVGGYSSSNFNYYTFQSIKDTEISVLYVSFYLS